MALIGNYSVLHKMSSRFVGGPSIGGNRAAYNKNGMGRNLHIGEASIPLVASIPSGYASGVAWVMPRKGGELVSRFSGSSTIGVHAVSAKNMVVPVSGSSTVGVAVGLITALAASITGSSTLAASATGSIGLSADLSGSSTLAAGVRLIVDMESDIAGSSTVAAGITGLSSMSVAIASYTELSSEGLAAAVWSAIATQNNVAGTMGEKWNDSGSAGPPWATTVPGAYAEGTAGALMGKLLTTAKFLGLK